MQFVMLLCNSETEFGVHKKPFWVFSINSGIPPINEPTTGVPMQRASIILKGLFSYHLDGTTKHLDLFTKSSTFSLGC